MRFRATPVAAPQFVRGFNALSFIAVLTGVSELWCSAILTMNAKETITQAITNTRLLQFYYDGGTRIVEPHQLAYNEANHLALSAYWVGGYSESRDTSTRWREYLVDQMSAVLVKDETFSGPRPGYKRTPNKKFRSAIAQL